MKEFRIIASRPNDICSSYKAQVKCRFLFWTYWVDIICSTGATWQWTKSDCEKLIKLYNGEISDVVKTIKV